MTINQFVHRFLTMEILRKITANTSNSKYDIANSNTEELLK